MFGWIPRVLRWFKKHVVSTVSSALLASVVGLLMPSIPLMLDHWLAMPEIWRGGFIGAFVAYVLFSLSVSIILLVENRYINLSLIPSRGPSPRMVLGVKNKRKTRRFTAQCEIVSRRHDPNDIHSRNFDLKWENIDNKWYLITKNTTTYLEIAEWNIDYEQRLAEMKLVGLKGDQQNHFESSKWNLGPDGQLPEYDLKISIFGDGVEKPYVDTFTVRPRTQNGPLEMVRINE